MRIGIDARFYGSLGKGLGRYTEKLIEHLERIDSENEYIIFLRRENFDEYHPRNPRFKKVLAHYDWYGFSEQTFFLLQLYRAHLDLMHFPHFNVPVLYLRKFVVTIHDLILLHYPTLRNTTRGFFLYAWKFLVYRFVIARAIQRAVHVITVSEFTKKDILKNYPAAEGKVTVTYEAADPFCQCLDPRSEEGLFGRLGLIKREKQNTETKLLRDIITPYILYVGNAYPHKNLDIIFSVAKDLPECTFVLVGKEDYFYSRLKQRAESQNIRNVIFSGFVNDTELSTLYRFGWLYVFPSLYEGFGLPPLEAMSRGLPVLSSDRGSLPEILSDAAVYFDPKDAEDLSKKITELSENSVLRVELVEKGYKQSKKYSFPLMARETYQVYENSLKQKIAHVSSL